MQGVPVSPLVRLSVGPGDHSRLGASLGWQQKSYVRDFDTRKMYLLMES